METYLVFARAAYADPLCFQGTLQAPAGKSPNQLALDAYGGDWVELALISVAEAHWAIQEETPLTTEAEP
jgi:hypothetical protein